MDLKVISLFLTLYLFSCCTPYWENESFDKIDQYKVTKIAQETLSESVNQQNENKIITGGSDLMMSAMKLREKTGELSNEIDELLIDIDEL